MKKVVLIYNPYSGDKTFINYLDYIIDKFQKKYFELYLFRIDKSKRFENLFKKIKENEKEYAKILVAGGDGTINQIVNFMIKYELDIPLGIYPVGTCNDFSVQFNIEKDVKKQTDILLANNYTLSDIGLINNKVFINVASFGSLVSTSQKVDNNAKAVLGPWAYYLKALEELVQMHPLQVEIETDEGIIKEDIFFILIMNGTSAGGFSKIANQSKYDDGLFDIVILKKCMFTDYPSVWLDILAGKHANNKNIIYMKSKKVNINCQQKVITDIDGENGPDFPLEIRILEKRLKVITK